MREVILILLGIKQTQKEIENESKNCALERKSFQAEMFFNYILFSYSSHNQKAKKKHVLVR